MRSTGLFLIGLVSGAFSLPACSSDTTPVVYIELAYQVRCLDCDPRAPDYTEHNIKHVDGEAGYAMACSVTKLDGARRVTFSATHIDPMNSSTDHSLKVSLANIDGDDTDRPFDVRILEGATTYVGSGTSDSPSDSQPCQARFTVKDNVINGGLYCAHIPSDSDIANNRYVVAPATSSDPAPFKLYGCQGL
jgi:hypothetical protein